MNHDDKSLQDFGLTIRSMRASRDMSQEQLAESCGLDRTYISDIERGKRNIGLLNVMTLARALGVPVAELFSPQAHAVVESDFVINEAFSVDCGFPVTATAVLQSVLRANRVMQALPSSLFRTVDFKAQSGMVGAVFASELASEVGAMPNPIEKGHPDIVPRAAAEASEAELRNYPRGLEVKSTIGTITQGIKRAPGQARIIHLTGLTWQAHHRDVKQLMGMAWDYVGGTSAESAPPSITGVFFSNELSTEDWGEIAGTTGRNTKVTGMKVTGRNKMAAGAVVCRDNESYLGAFRARLGPLPRAMRS